MCVCSKQMDFERFDNEKKNYTICFLARYTLDFFMGFKAQQKSSAPCSDSNKIFLKTI